MIQCNRITFSQVNRKDIAVEIVVTFAGVTFKPGHMLYADNDGIIDAERALNS